MMQQFLSSWSLISTEFLDSVGAFLPRLLGAGIVFLVGLALAKLLRRILRRVLQAINFSQLINKTPIQLALENPEVGRRVEVAVVSLVYWLMMLLVIHTTAAILGLGSVTLLIEKILNYLPQIFSAVLVLGFGVILAGVVESLVKGSVRSMGMRQAIWLGKLASYLVICIAILSSLSELGIAREFITILFVGFISTLTLGFGLALGLGGKDTVSRILAKWYDQNIEVESPSSTEVETPKKK
jgi:hypothetical protein